MKSENQDSLSNQLQRVLKDGLNYLESLLAVLQARFTEYALSAILFFVLIIFSSLLVIAGFVTFNIAFGVWLANQLGSTTVALVILGGFYTLLAVLIGWRAIRWLMRLKS